MYSYDDDMGICIHVYTAMMYDIWHIEPLTSSSSSSTLLGSMGHSALSPTARTALLQSPSAARLPHLLLLLLALRWPSLSLLPRQSHAPRGLLGRLDSESAGQLCLEARHQRSHRRLGIGTHHVERATE